jgi:hypothetical protein
MAAKMAISAAAKNSVKTAKVIMAKISMAAMA